MIHRFFPFLAWFKTYSKADLRADLTAGLTVALVLIPQSMAYAQLAGLPPYFGLYAAFLPPMIASLFGSSRQLATGPVAVVSLMTSASLAPLATSGSPGYIAYAIMLSLTVGIFQLALGALRLGVVVNFLSHPVVNGFTNAAAIIIATSQFSNLFGVYVENAEHHYETILRVIREAVHYTHWPTFGMGVLSFAVMYGLKRLNPRIPYVLVAVIITTSISFAFRFEKRMSAPLQAIEVPEAQELVSEFNQAMSEAEQLTAERPAITAELAKVKKEQGAHSVAYLELKHQMETLNLRIDILKEEAEVKKQKIRYTLFTQAEGSDGKPRFVPFEVAPPGTATDGQVWRIKMGNKVLDENSVRMISGGAVVGEIPKGLPAFAIPKSNITDLLTLLPYAVIISLLGYMEAISIAKAMAAKTGQMLNPNQELIGQGLANILGSVGQSYPTSGSFSRSAVNLQSGAVTGLSSVVTSITVVITLLFFTPLLYHLPQASLAAVIMMAVMGLVSVSSFVHAWKTHRVDGAIQIISFISTLIFAPHLHKGILIGVGLSLGVYIYRSMRPRVAHLALHPDGSYRDAEHWGLNECKHIAMIRFDGPLFFANASYFEDLVNERVKSMPELKHILLVANGINDMDASGEEVLALTVDNVRAAGIGFSMSGVKEEVLALIKRTHLFEKIGEEHIFPTMAQGVAVIYMDTHKGSDEGSCPLLPRYPVDESVKRKGGIHANHSGDERSVLPRGRSRTEDGGGSGV